MSLKYLQSLLMRSAKVNQEIDREERQLRPDWLRLLRLKKLRLAIKDNLYSLGLASPGEVRPARAYAVRRNNSANA